MKPTILVDQDGPLSGFDERFWEICASEGIALDCALEEQRHRFATDHIPNKADRERARALVNTSGWFADLPVVDGAIEGLNRLADIADVWICSKPLAANPTCRDEKAAWLARHFGSYWADRLILAPDKSMITGDVLLDDAPKLAWLPRAQWVPVVFTTPWNGPGSNWEQFAHWDWAEDVTTLIDHVWRTNA